MVITSAQRTASLASSTNGETALAFAWRVFRLRMLAVKTPMNPQPARSPA